MTEEEDNGLVEELAKHKPLCYYEMKDGFVNEDKVIFERLDMSMEQNLNPMFIRAKVDNMGINNVLIDGGSCINIIPHFLLRKIGKFDTNLKPHNMVLSNYEGKMSKTLGVIQVDVVLGKTSRFNLFVVIPTKTNYNLLHGREWIHVVGVVPSTMHQRITI